MLKEDFINKIKEKYPDNFNKYDYSLLPNEFKVIDKINIICKTHGTFEQIAYNHLRGNDCLKCVNEYKSNINKSNKEEFKDIDLPIYIPSIGAGLANGDWKVIQGLIEKSMGSNIHKIIHVLKDD